MHRRLLPLLLVAIGVAAVVWFAARGDDGENKTSESPRGDPPRADAVRDCRTHIEGRLPPADARDDLIAGPVRFRGFRAASRFATRERGRGFFEIRDGEYHGQKFVTEVRAGIVVTVAIGPESRDKAALLFDPDIEYGRFGIPFEQGQRAVRFRACSASHPADSPRHYGRRTVGPWTQFNGGFVFVRPQCLKLDVYVPGRAARRFVEPFGRPRRACVST